MNILVPDSWLREFLHTKATPQQIKEYLSLCGPSVERIHDGNIYDIEITTNRPDAMSIFGVAREASVILPRFGIPATLLHDPYQKKYAQKTIQSDKKLTIKTDSVLNPRWTSVILEQVQIKESPKWLQEKLTQTGIRPINTIVDITNYLMRAFGQPAHAFDYDKITGHTMILRASKKGEILTTLDGKKHNLPGDDIVIEDGSGNLIDLCGIMGGQNSAISDTTTRVVLFLQSYEQVHIRKSMMKLSHRTEAGSLFEKGTDSELVLPALLEGILLAEKISGAVQTSPIYDIYPKPFKPYTVLTKKSKLDTYIGTKLDDKEISTILTDLHFAPKINKDIVTITVPSFRRDITLDVDIIEEIARIYGYHAIGNKLPEGQVPIVQPDPILYWEQEIKIRLRDWGYTELLTYSMVSTPTENAYKLSNPLSDEWQYLRTSLAQSVIPVVLENQKHTKNLNVFELSNVYEWQKNNLPKETPRLAIAISGKKFLQIKGVAESIFMLMGISQPIDIFGSIEVLEQMTYLELDFAKLIKAAHPHKTFTPIPKYPPAVEDLAFIVPEKFEIGPLMDAFAKTHPLITNVSLLDIHENTRTVHITYQDPEKNLTDEGITPIRKKLITLALEKFGIKLKE